MIRVGVENMCAKCKHFTRGDVPETAAPGQGRCTMFVHVVDWNERWCVLFTAAKKMSERMEWIQQQQTMESKKDIENEST